jgi:hypothetical protein
MFASWNLIPAITIDFIIIPIYSGRDSQETVGHPGAYVPDIGEFGSTRT